MKTINVKTSCPYEVKVGRGLLNNIAAEIAEIKKPGKCIIISDDNVWALYGEKVKTTLRDGGYTVTEAVFPHGEESKNMETALSLLESCFEAGLTRSDFAIALGGGIVGDVTGFVSSMYLRGIDFIQIPTTLLAAIDSSVGGKTGVNCSHGKNLIGAFHQPVKVICDIDTFNTLPEEIYTAGICEALKYGVIRDEDLFEQIIVENGDIEESVYRCIKIKADIVENDEFDHGERQLLNFGHTFGHSIEALSNYEISHGHGVGIGMLLITRACETKDICPRGTADRIKAALLHFGLQTEVDYTPKQLTALAMSDKKRKADTITLVVPEKIGKCVLHTIATKDIEGFITL